MKTELKIEGMTCGHCVARVTGALEGVPGVSKAEVNREAGSATVEHEATVEQLVEAVEEQGYKAKAA